MMNRDQWTEGKKVKALDYDEAELKKYGLDTQKMYDGNGRQLTEKEAIETMRKRFAYAGSAAKVMFEKLNEKSVDKQN